MTNQVYQLTIQTPTKVLTMQTTDPDDVLEIMKLSGQKVMSHDVIAISAPEEIESEFHDDEYEDSETTDSIQDEDFYDLGEEEVEEDFENTPNGTRERQPRVHGDITDFGARGTGHGQKGSANNKPYGSGDNPLTFESLRESFSKFKGE
jgi:hypothetical protein